MAWQFDSQSPVFSQIVSRIKADILNGTYPPGAQIPPVRALAMEAGVNPNTMQRAMSMLENEKILFSSSTAGRFVTDDTETLSAMKNAVFTTLVSDFTARANAVGMDKETCLKLLSEVMQ